MRPPNMGDPGAEPYSTGPWVGMPEALRRGKSYGKRMGRRRWLLWSGGQKTCAYCYVTLAFEETTIDHVTPRSKGGSNNMANLTIACIECNARKADS